MSRILLLAALIGLLTGCSPIPEVTPVATPQLLRIEISSGLDWLRPEMAECVQHTPGLSLSVMTTGVPEQSLNEADLLLRWSDQAVTDGFAFVLGEDSLAIIVHPDNSIEILDLSAIKDIYSGQMTAWPGASNSTVPVVQPWVFPTDDELQDFFETRLLADGRIVQTAKIAPTPAALLEAVAKDPQAIGFLPARWLDPSVKTIEILDFPLKDLNMPILAVTAVEPTGPMRDWLLCVQERINP